MLKGAWSAGRVVVRYSGTEPILRIMAEGENPELVGALVIRLRSQLESAFASDGT
jgi:phosphomannomutase